MARGLSAALIVFLAERYLLCVTWGVGAACIFASILQPKVLAYWLSGK